VRNFNPDLPILDEIGRELEQLAAASPTALRPAAAPPARRRRGAHSASRRGARITRRAGVLLVLLCLVGGVALAARFAAGGDRAPSHTAPALLGRAGGGAWRVSAYRDQGRLCFLLMTPGGALTSECGSEPGAEGVRATSLNAAGQRLVAGLAGPRVAAVEVRSAGQRADAPTHAAADPGAAAEAGVPAGSRWFVVALPDGPAGSDPALVTPLDRAGQRLGRPYLDCSLGVIGRGCERRIRAAASAAERGA
jgi:hypothetical protein